jgi:hypothetical protein
MLGGDGFWVELHAVDWQRAVLQTHNEPIRLGGDLEFGRQRVAFDDEGMVPRGGERIFYARK